MSNRKFLVPLAAAIAALTQNTNAAPSLTGPRGPTESLAPTVSQSTIQMPSAGESSELLVPVNGDLFKFVLRRAEDGVMVADHYSHSSHRSHASHRSHYSGS